MELINNGDVSVITAPTDTKAAHVVILPFPILGRTNPMLQFSKRLSSKGLKVTLATTPAFTSKLLPNSSPFLTIATISDSFDAAPSDTNNIDDYVDRFVSAAPQSLSRLIREQESQENPVRCLVYDSSLTWALGLARELGIYAAPFFPQSCAVSLIVCHVFKGLLAAPPPPPVDGGRLLLPGLPEVDIGDLPSFVQEVGKFPLLEKVVYKQFENFDQADWQFFNTFDVLEKQVLNWMLKKWPNVTPIGPAIPSMYLDRRLEDDKEYGLSLFTPEIGTCIKWLDTKEDCSTIYLSFGSLAALDEEQMEELASGLKNSNKPFLWVVRASEENKLPTNFKDEVSGQKGIIVNWCHQLAVLAHRAVGCFFTHCGWNSTLEAISLGVPMVGMPQWADQPTNAMFFEDVWRVGVRVKADDKGVVRREEVERCVREVMDRKKGEEMRSNALKLKIQANAAMQEGGSSDMNIEGFVAKIKI